MVRIKGHFIKNEEIEKMVKNNDNDGHEREHDKKNK